MKQKVVLLFFSGTFLTLQITSFIKNSLLNKGYDVDSFSLENNDKINFDNYDYVFIGYPIHAFNAPKFVETKIKQYDIKNKKIIIYKVSGEPFKYNNASSYKIYKILKKNNNILMNEYHLLMPYNIIFRTKEDFIRYELEYDLKYIDYITSNLDRQNKYKISIFSRFITFIFKIQRFGCKINSKLYKVDKEKCIKCRRCQQNCPTHNVTYNKEKHKIVFSNKCIMCMRCSFYCPSDAISIGFLNKWKVNGSYDIYSIIKQECTYDYINEKEKFYLKFKPYFEKIDNLIQEK